MLHRMAFRICLGDGGVMKYEDNEYYITGSIPLYSILWPCIIAVNRWTGGQAHRGEWQGSEVPARTRKKWAIHDFPRRERYLNI